MSKPTDLVQGTLDLLIMKMLALEPMHGWAIAQRLKQVSNDTLQVSDGSLYPALHKRDRESPERCPLRFPHDAPESGLHRSGGDVARARHRREYRGVHLYQRDLPAHLACAESTGTGAGHCGR